MLDLTIPSYVHFNPASDFGQQRRNQFIGSGYTDTDLDLTKGFKVPHWESANLKVGAQFFNLFNHRTLHNRWPMWKAKTWVILTPWSARQPQSPAPSWVVMQHRGSSN